MSKKIKRIHATFLILLFFWMVVLGVIMMNADVKKARRCKNNENTK